MDGDDIAYPQRLTLQLAYLQQYPEVDLVGAWALVFDSNFSVRGRRMTPESHADICAAPWAGFPLLHPTYMGRKAWYESFPYDEGLSKAQDQVLLAGSCISSRFANVQEVLLAYREDIPTLSKLWASRGCMLRGMFKVYIRQGRTGLACRVVLAQGLRMLADLVATVLPLRTFQLSRRSGPLGVNDVRRWEELLKNIHAKDTLRA